MSYYIYIIQNQINNKIYVGQTIRPKIRWATHRRSAKAYKDGKSSEYVQYIHKAMAKHGIKNFQFQIIETWQTQNDINDAEIFWIQYFKSKNNRFGYNETIGGIALGSGPDHPCYGKPAHNKLFSDDQEKEICKRYLEEKLSISALAKEYNCTCIYSILKRHNIEILGNKILSKGKRYSIETEFKKNQTPHNKLFNKNQEQEIIDLYNSGLNCPQIAKKYGCNRSIIQRLLKRNNIPIRKRKAAVI